MILALMALSYTVWAEATQVRHFSGTPDAYSTWLFLSPALACILSCLGLAWEQRQAQGLAGRAIAGGRGGQDRQVLSWPQLARPALGLQWGGLALLSWRSIWMFFSWDGLFLFPGWCLLAAAVAYRWHARWAPCA